VLYATSAIVGSLGSAFFLKANLSVGASGALWGMLAAHAILAFRSRGLLPAALIPGAQRAAKINLVINVLNSFRPYVDMWAHFAGGFAGAVLFLSGLLTRRLAKLGEMEQEDSIQGAGAGARIPTPPLIGALAAVAGLVLVAGPVGALVLGRPLALVENLSLAPTTLQDLGVVVSLPPGLSKNRLDSPNGPELSFGEVLADPLMVSVFVVPIPPLDDDGLAAEMEGLRKGLQMPSGSKPLAPPLEFRRGEERGLTVSYSYDSGLVFERAFMFMQGKLIRVDALRWPAHPGAAPEGSARRIAETAKPLST